MIIYKVWVKRNHFERITHRCRGWFLFGFIPLYIINQRLETPE